MKTLDARTSAEWRAWLAAHHDSESEVWLIFHKRHTGESSIAYNDAVDEALCFGWIDSLIKRVDDARYARKFTPRQSNSKWSTTNRARYAQLRASGRLAPAGLKLEPTQGSSNVPQRPATEIPQYIEKALKSRSAASHYFERLAPSHRRKYIAWIDSAKQHETKMRRLRQAIDRLQAGKKLGLK